MIPGLEQSWLWGLVGDDAAARIWSAERQAERMIAFESAHARALGKAGVVESARAERLATAIDNVTLDLASLQSGTRRDGVPIVELVAQLKAAVADDADRIHLGATSQDVIDTGLVLTLREMTILILARLTDTTSRLDVLIARFGDEPLLGRTRMQAAEPIRVFDRLIAWLTPLLDHAERLALLRPRIERLQFGGAAGNRAALGKEGDAVARHLAEALDLDNPPRAWHATRESVVEYADHLVRLTGTLGKIGQDIALMSQQGIDEIVIAGGGTSSAMPHKRNPIDAELLITLARFNATLVAGLHQAMIHEQERSGAAWALEWLILPQITVATARSLDAATSLLDRVERMGSR